MRRLLMILALFLTITGAALAAEEGYASFPAALRFTQQMSQEHLDYNRNIYATYPDTARADVNAAIRDVVDRMLEAGRAQLPQRGGEGVQTRLDVGPYIHRLGTRWMSFLTIGRIAHQNQQLWLDFDARTYNMETGELVTLDQVVDRDSGGLVYLARLVQRQLVDYFPDQPCDLNMLREMTSEEALLNTPFTLSAGHLTLLYRADSLYEGHNLLMRVEVYYPDLKPYMTDMALAETDCRAYQMLAFTYDDGPARGTTENLLNQLRLHGADATFFVVGDMVKRAPEVIIRQNDAGFAVQSHNYEHVTAGLTPEKILRWKDQMDELMTGILGVKPTMMRTPGGMDDFYIRAGVNLPLIHWSRISGDADANPELRENAERIARKVSYALDGEIVLCHDLNGKAPGAAAIYLEVLDRREVMLVTVADLCAVRGHPLRPNEVVWCTGDDSQFGQ